MENILRRVKRIYYWRELRWQRQIDRVCIGYSGASHWEFFKRILSGHSIQRILMLGVYHGRDIAYMAAILRSLRQNNYLIWGVDKFADEPGNDWPEESRGLSWQEAGFGPAPDLERAHANLRTLGLASRVVLKRDLAESFLASTKESFDFIYIDLSHDYETTMRAIDLAVERLRRDGVIGGDDFSDQGSWGVASAVRESFSRYSIYRDWLWCARATDYQRKLNPPDSQ